MSKDIYYSELKQKKKSGEQVVCVCVGVCVSLLYKIENEPFKMDACFWIRISKKLKLRFFLTSVRSYCIRRQNTS